MSLFSAGLLGWSGLCNNVRDNQVSLPSFRSWCYPCTQSGRFWDSYSSSFKVGCLQFVSINWTLELIGGKYPSLIHIMYLFFRQHFTFLSSLSQVGILWLIISVPCNPSFLFFLNKSCWFYTQNNNNNNKCIHTHTHTHTQIEQQEVRWSLTKIKLAITLPVSLAITLTGQPAYTTVSNIIPACFRI